MPLEILLEDQGRASAFLAKCDYCGASYRFSAENEEKARAFLTLEGWKVKGNIRTIIFKTAPNHIVACPACFGIHAQRREKNMTVEEVKKELLSAINICADKGQNNVYGSSDSQACLHYAQAAEAFANAYEVIIAVGPPDHPQSQGEKEEENV